MANRNTILNALMTDMMDYLTPSRGYNVDLGEVKRGIYYFEDVSIKPAVCFWCYRDASEGAFNHVDKRTLYIYMYGYTDNTGVEDVDEIHNLASDVEYFLYNDFSYTNDTFVGDVVVYESGDNASGSMFELELRITYDKITNTH